MQRWFFEIIKYALEAGRRDERPDSGKRGLGRIERLKPTRSYDGKIEKNLEQPDQRGGQRSLPRPEAKKE